MGTVSDAQKGSRLTTATLQWSRNEIPGGEAYSGLVQVKSSTSQSVYKFLKLRIQSEFPDPTDRLHSRVCGTALNA